jgi:hypothetical protein
MQQKKLATTKGNRLKPFNICGFQPVLIGAEVGIELKNHPPIITKQIQTAKSTKPPKRPLKLYFAQNRTAKNSGL